MKARVVVNKIREKYLKWGEDEEDEVCLTHCPDPAVLNCLLRSLLR
jgi:hypothetical protein